MYLEALVLVMLHKDNLERPCVVALVGRGVIFMLTHSGVTCSDRFLKLICNIRKIETKCWSLWFTLTDTWGNYLSLYKHWYINLITRGICAKHFTPWLSPFHAVEIFGRKIPCSKACHLLENRQYCQKRQYSLSFTRAGTTKRKKCWETVIIFPHTQD